MKDGYIRVAALTPKIKVGDCVYNGEQIKALIKEAYNKDTAVAVFPELCITGYTCNDLFLQDTLIDEAMNVLLDIRDYTSDYKGMLVITGIVESCIMLPPQSWMDIYRDLCLRCLYPIMVSFMKEDSLQRALKVM